MSIPGAASPLFLATTGAAGAFEISRSLRFNSGDSAYLNRTPSSASNRKTFTLSAWVKRSALGASQTLFEAGPGGNPYTLIHFNSSDQLVIPEDQGSGGVYYPNTLAVFRDVSAWYHFVIAFDTTQATSTNRIKVYVNGAQQELSNSYPAQNHNTYINSQNEHRIGNRLSNSLQLSAYLAEVNFIDGQALDSSSFGKTDDNGVWQAKDTAGLTFGTNGFRLKFADNSSNAALGTDSSGNSNTWSVNNLVATVAPTANQGFDVVTYTGNGGSQTISSLAFAPDFVWIKPRNAANSHNLYDIVRGDNKRLVSNATSGEQTVGMEFESNGFTPTGSNDNGTTYVAWCWKADGAAASNTDGTITSQVSASTAYGFSIIKYNSGSSTGNYTLGHGLPSAPKFIIHKQLTTGNWWVFHASVIDNTAKYLQLNSAAAIDTNSGPMWGAALPTSSVFGIRVGDLIGTSTDAIAYAWSEVAGFSKFGSYSGSSSNVTVNTGFKPRYIIIKSDDTAGQEWVIKDSERGGDRYLEANTSNADAAGRNVTFNADGFTLAHTNGPTNYTGRSYIYAAFAEEGPNASVIDSLVDSPSNAATPTDTGVGNEVVGNYATLNAVQTVTNAPANGNLEISGSSTSTYTKAVSTIYIDPTDTTGYYCEFTVKVSGSNPGSHIQLVPQVNLTNNGKGETDGVGLGQRGGGGGNKWYKLTDQSSGTDTGVTHANGQVIGVAVKNGKLYMAIDNTWVLSGNPTSESNPLYSSLSGLKGFLVGTLDGNIVCNFGQRAFAYSAPSGYKSLNTANLPPPTIADGSKYFEAKKYVGNGGTQTIPLPFSPNLIWVKGRNSSNDHELTTTLQPANKALASNITDAEFNTVIEPGTDGFFLDGNSIYANENNINYISWNWDGGTGNPVTNNDGSIASQVRAQPSAGFSIVSYTGTGANATFGHGLNAAPEMVIIKQRNGTGFWVVGHKSAGFTSDNYLYLNGTNANSSGGGVAWQSTAPTSSVVSIGTSNILNGNNNTHIAFCFAPVAGYSSMGSYVGNGSSSGPFIHTGFRPRFYMYKRIDSTGSWVILDAARPGYNTVDRLLSPDLSNAESTYNMVDFCANGIKIRNGYSADNGNGGTFIYYAVSENPFQANGGLAR